MLLKPLLSHIFSRKVLNKETKVVFFSFQNKDDCPASLASPSNPLALQPSTKCYLNMQFSVLCNNYNKV